MRYRLTRAASLSVLLALLVVSAQAQQAASLPADKLEKIEKAITAQMSRQGIPGLSVAVVVDRKLRWSNGYGLADVENFVPSKAMTAYRLGSISKPITAAAVMQLAERGKLDLDPPIQKYCPAFPEKQWPITARLLLGHLSGVRHYKDQAEVGSTRHYSIRVDNVFDIIPNRAQGYQKTQNGELRNSGLADTSYKIPGGGFISTVEDLAKFAIAMQTGALVKKETLDQMWTAQKTRDGKPTVYGLGWGVSERNGTKEVHHGGAQQRVSTFLYTIPEKGLAVVLMTNLEGIGGGLANLSRQIADILLQ